MTPAIAAVDPPTMRNARLRVRGAICIAAVWSLALILPAYSQLFDPANGQIVLQGYKVLGSGWIAIVAGQLAWLANPALLVLLVTLTSRPFSDRASRIAALLLLASLATMIDLVRRPEFNGYPHLLIGGWLWLANNLAAAVFAFVVTVRHVSSKA